MQSDLGGSNPFRKSSHAMRPPLPLRLAALHALQCSIEGSQAGPDRQLVVVRAACMHTLNAACPTIESQWRL
ncbi:hypothetical protein AGR4C_pa50035 [Agrobacterium tumefaciens str. Kerr 14]|uniref:Uncharacterized protein n=1 Tax=Agrobacterium tumefaciens str. Kerr 14 TaxID=1183424 RepID=A0A1S7SB42_AGRTU|nr:hypothetical protein AGR4C_pa50035 [Agrobacterium tumefaciens str. Kerr 14]